MGAEIYITRTEAAELSGTSTTVVNKAIEQRAVQVKASGRGSLVDARDVGALRVFHGLQFGLPVAVKRRVAVWLREAEPGAELALTTAVIVRKSAEIDELIGRALRYVDLRSRYLEVNPDRQGGEPVIRGTRIPIRGLAKQIEAGETMDVLRREYDYVDPEAFEFAVMWAKANPRRGRPTKTRRLDADAVEPARRAELLQRRRHAAATEG